MKKMYEQPTMQAEAMNAITHILASSNIGEGGEGKEGDVKDFGLLDASENSCLFEDNPFE